MEFFGIGTWELMVIGLIALIVLGPKQMIILARRAGELLRQFQAIWQEASKTIDKEIKAIEAEAGDLTQLPKEITALTNEMKNALTLETPPNGKSQPATPAPPASVPSIRPPDLAAPPSAWATPPTQPPAILRPRESAADTQHPEPPDPLVRPDTPAEPEKPKYSAWTTKKN